MNFLEIREFPTSITAEQAREGLDSGCKGFHESLTRSYHILASVRDLIRKGTPLDVVMELIELMDSQ